MRVTENTYPELKWTQPPGTWLMYEMVQADAFTTLTKSEIMVLMWILSRRAYPSNKRKKGKHREKLNSWQPKNHDNVLLPYKAFVEFYGRQQMSKQKSCSEKTFYTAINKLMAVGFVSLVKLGGNGVGDMSVYRFEHNWRIWRAGDKPCFTKAGFSNSAGIQRAENGQYEEDWFDKYKPF